MSIDALTFYKTKLLITPNYCQPTVNSIPVDESEFSDSSYNVVDLPIQPLAQTGTSRLLVQARNGSTWEKILTSSAITGRLQQHTLILSWTHIIFQQPALFLKVQSHHFEYSLTSRCCEISRNAPLKKHADVLETKIGM